MENNQELNEEMYLEEQEEPKKYSAKKGLKFGIDVLIKLEKVIAIILAALAILEFIAGIILSLDSATETTGMSAIILGVVLGLYAIFTFYVIKRINSKNYNYNVNDVVFTFFISIPLAVLMIVAKGYDKE